MRTLIKSTRVFVCLSAMALFAAGCGDDDDGNNTTADAGGSSADSGGGNATTYNVTLSKGMESPTCANAGASAAGMAVVVVSADNSSIMATVQYTGLSGAATLAHIHSGAVAANGNPVLNFTVGPSPIVKTFTAADYSPGTGTGAGPATFAEFVTQLKAGRAYVNVHTAMCGAGEIRGQIQ